MTDVEAQSPPEQPILHLALDRGNQALAESIVSVLQPSVGPDYLIIEIQRYLIHRQGMGTLTEAASNIALDLLEPLREASQTLEDAGYVAPNLSPEVAALLLFVSTELIKEVLASGSPNWYMIPSGPWRKFVKLAQAAAERHAK